MSVVWLKSYPKKVLISSTTRLIWTITWKYSLLLGFHFRMNCNRSLYCHLFTIFQIRGYAFISYCGVCMRFIIESQLTHTQSRVCCINTSNLKGTNKPVSPGHFVNMWYNINGRNIRELTFHTWAEIEISKRYLPIESIGNKSSSNDVWTMLLQLCISEKSFEIRILQKLALWALCSECRVKC